MYCKKFMHRIVAIMMIAVLPALTACSMTSGSASSSIKTFDFGVPKRHNATSTIINNQTENQTTTTHVQFKLADIQVSNNLDGDAMLYRLLYNNAQELLPYSQSRWSMPPAQLLSQRIKSHVNHLGGMVVSSNVGANDLPLLRIELEEFSQHFTTPSNSYASLQFRASLLHHNRILAQKHFATTSPSPTADAAGGAQAMPLATDMALTELSAWIQAQLTSIP